MNSPKQIASFSVDHRFITKGIYVSRIDGDIVTYDIRTRKPNTGDLMDNATMHSLEHLFATFIRSSKIGNEVIYFGPMGCQTGFYLLVRGLDNMTVLNTIKDTLREILAYDGKMPGQSEIECGNYRNLSMEKGKAEAKAMLDFLEDWKEEDFKYKTE